MKKSILVIFILINQICIMSSISANPKYISPLSDAVYENDLSEVKKLILQGENINEQKSFYGNHTPLMIACKEGFTEIAIYLLSKGAKTDLQTRDGHTALMMAANNRNVEIVKVLLEYNADVNFKSKQGHTALSEVIQQEREQIKKMLIQAGAKQ